MERFASKVIEFNRDVLGIEVEEKRLLTPANKDFLVKAMREEVDEFLFANDDYVAHVDALIDLIYFAIGGLYKLGLTAQEISDAAHIVHGCNVQKKLGVKESRGDGTVPDATKPEGWKGPELQLVKLIFGGIRPCPMKSLKTPETESNTVQDRTQNQTTVEVATT